MHVTGQLAYTGGEGCSVLSYVGSQRDVLRLGAPRHRHWHFQHREHVRGRRYPFDATTGVRRVSSASAIISQANC
jgi:hypothetical protein